MKTLWILTLNWHSPCIFIFGYFSVMLERRKRSCYQGESCWKEGRKGEGWFKNYFEGRKAIKIVGLASISVRNRELQVKPRTKKVHNYIIFRNTPFHKNLDRRPLSCIENISGTKIMCGGEKKVLNSMQREGFGMFTVKGGSASAQKHHGKCGESVQIFVKIPPWVFSLCQVSLVWMRDVQ